MPVYVFDPVQDPRWPEFLAAHPDASVFHTPAWLNALRATYGYRAVAFTQTPPGEALRDGVVACAVESWLTGRRLVSVPFADHCEPLAETAEDRARLVQQLGRFHAQRRWKYIEMRPTTMMTERPAHAFAAQQFYWHTLDLQPPAEALFKSFHNTSIRQMVRRAERAKLRVESGTGPGLLDDFYRLLVSTRRRQRIPPQPIAWFRNLLRFFADSSRLWVCYAEARPAAAILTLRFGQNVVYKQSCSDWELRNLGGTPLLLWHAIQEAKQLGATTFDFGRSDPDNHVLITFKDNWATTRHSLCYIRLATRSSQADRPASTRAVAQRVVGSLPGPLLIMAGRLLYRHIA